MCLTISSPCLLYVAFFLFKDTTTTEISTLSLHDALPIYQFVVVNEFQRLFQRQPHRRHQRQRVVLAGRSHVGQLLGAQDRKSTRLNSSHPSISYAVFCLKKKKPNG